MSAITKIKSLAAFFALVSALWHPIALPLEPSAVTVLCYHTFDAKIKTPYTVPHQRFDEEMRYLAAQKIPVIPLSALIDHLYRKTPLPERAVVITIDDGYKTAEEIAWPVLRRYGYPFTLFVYPQAIGRFPSALTWDDVRRLAAAGVDIQSHSLTHPLLTHPAKAMNKKEYDAWIDEELIDSKHRIEQELRRPVTSIAYPYGGYDEFIVDRARAAGYQAALTCDDGDAAEFTDPYRINRRLVFRQTTLKTFTGYFKEWPLQVTDLSPKDGERVKDIPHDIQARILNLERIRPETVQILVDKLGSHWRPVAIDPKTGLIRFTLPPVVRRGYYFVSLVAEDKKDPAVKREASWLFIVKRNTSKK